MGKFTNFVDTHLMFITFLFSFLFGSIILMTLIKFLLRIDPSTHLHLFVLVWLFLVGIIEITNLVIAKIRIHSAEYDLVRAPEKNDSKIINFLNNHQKLSNFLAFLKSYFEIIAGYYSIYLFFYIHKGWSMANRKPHFNNYKNHVGIVVNIYHDYFGREYCYGFGVDLLINSFNNITPYSIYPCKNKNDFFKIVSNPHVTSIWIFGHGDHGGVRYGDGIFDYRDLMKKLPQNFPKKDSIYQMHCNDGNLISLVDLLSDGRGFVNNTKNYPYEIRYYVKKILTDSMQNTAAPPYGDLNPEGK